MPLVHKRLLYSLGGFIALNQRWNCSKTLFYAYCTALRQCHYWRHKSVLHIFKRMFWNWFRTSNAGFISFCARIYEAQTCVRPSVLLIHQIDIRCIYAVSSCSASSMQICWTLLVKWILDTELSTKQNFEKLQTKRLQDSLFNFVLLIFFLSTTIKDILYKLLIFSTRLKTYCSKDCIYIC
jgi:hypothetical protein